MQEYDYDYQRVIDAENAEKAVKKRPASVLPEPKKPPYARMFAADIVHTVACGFASVLLGAVSLLLTGDAVDTSSASFSVGVQVLGMLYWGLYVLIPFLFAKATYRTQRPRLAFMGCFYVQSILSSVLAGVTTRILDIGLNNLSEPDPEPNTVVLTGVSSSASTVVLIVFQLVVLYLVVKKMAENGLFEEEPALTKPSFGGQNPKIPVIAAVCAALMSLFTDGVGMIVSHFVSEEPGARNVLLTALSGLVSLGTVVLCFAVGKRICKRQDGALLFTGLVTGASAISFGKGAVDLIFAVVSALEGASMPGSVETAVSCVSVLAQAVVAALLVTFVFRRLNRAEEPTKITQ